MLPFAALVISCVALVAPAAVAQAPAGQVAVLLEPPVADFGTIAPSTSHVGTFTLRNLGSAPATVKAAVPTCKCTSFTDIVGKVVPAGGTLAFEATLKAPASPGERPRHAIDHDLQLRVLLARACRARRTRSCRS